MMSSETKKVMLAGALVALWVIASVIAPGGPLQEAAAAPSEMDVMSWMASATDLPVQMPRSLY